MKKILPFLFICIINTAALCQLETAGHRKNPIPDVSHKDSSMALEPYTYAEDFETRFLAAWASYPLWQDNAYDQNFRAMTFIPGDSNISLVQKVTPYSPVDNYAGAQKLLDMYMTPGSQIRFRYYLKSNSAVSSLKVRLAGGGYGKLDVTISNPLRNQWVEASVDFKDFLQENPVIRKLSAVRIYALAFLAKIEKADPDMPIYLALDDISFKGERAVPFHFEAPEMYKLPEFKTYIPTKAYHSGDSLHLGGTWPLDARSVSLKITSLTDPHSILYKGRLLKKGPGWQMAPFKMDFPPGLYIGEMTALQGSAVIGRSTFSIHILPTQQMGHPRLLFDETKKAWIMKRFKEKQFEPVYAQILKDAKNERENQPIKNLAYDLDQFPEENWLPSWTAFGNHLYGTASALKWNALAYSFSGDSVAGHYVKDLLVKISGWPSWVSPWLLKRGRYSDHRMGTWSGDVAIAYDLVYPLMNKEERAMVRKAIVDKIIKGAFETYVYDNDVISNTSNWIGHITGGALMCMAAIEEDGPEGNPGKQRLEPYFTGSLLKLYNFLQHVTDSVDGAWGEGYGYNNYTFANLTFSTLALSNVYHIDITRPLRKTYNEYIWGGLIQNRKWFGFGDSEDSLVTADNWAFLLDKYKDPRLGWFYNYLKGPNTFNDVLFETSQVPRQAPFSEPPVKAFKGVGTTVFKSGWETKDFAFVMRTGAFYNHQHLDQGSFYLADHGVVFIEDHPIHESDYYLDPLYQSDFIQPVAHSTILIDHNAESQRVGDPLHFAPGFHDHAFIKQFLDSKSAAFSSGDIGNLYWGKVKGLSRNVLFIKPRSLLMLDVVTPAKKDVDVTLLYHTKRWQDIQASARHSTITKQGFSLNIDHLYPLNNEVKAVGTPHFLNTLLKAPTLVKEGMISLTARTQSRPLVIANLLFSSQAGQEPVVPYTVKDGFATGTVDGQKFAFNLQPGKPFKVEDMETDGLSMTWGGQEAFVSLATLYRKKGIERIRAGCPITFSISRDSLSFVCDKESEVRIFTEKKPVSVALNKHPYTNYSYDRKSKMLIMQVSDGQFAIKFK